MGDQVSFEQIGVLSKWVAKSLEQMCFHQTDDLAVQTDANISEWMNQVVRTDANFLQTASKRLVKGISLKNRKLLVYVFL